MTPEERNILEKWNSRLEGDVTLTLVVTGDDRSAELKQFCDEVSEIAARLAIIEQQGEEGAAPSLLVARNLSYSAVPSGTELEPFLAAVSLFHEQGNAPYEMFREKLERVSHPADVNIFIAPGCPHCPAVVRSLTPVAAVSGDVSISVIDAFLFNDIAEDNGIQSVPSVLLDRTFRWTGAVSVQEIVNVIADRDPASLGPESIKSMLQEGDAEKLADMMIRREDVFPALYDVLTDEKWTVRLGAMVVVETLVEKNRAVASKIIAPLRKRFSSMDDQARGDVIYLFGEAGDTDTLEILHDIMEGAYSEEVREAAEEAVRSINERTRAH